MSRALLALLTFGCAHAAPTVNERERSRVPALPAVPPATPAPTRSTSTRSDAPSAATTGALGAVSRPEPLVAAKPSPAVAAPPDMLPVPGGTFEMGTNDEGEQDERPAHLVTVRPFWLDRTEVTQAAYAACVKTGRCAAPDSLTTSALVNGRAGEFRLPEHPVVGVSWFDASAYCAFRTRRLPTEAEWERAARGADGRRYVWGNDPPDPRRFGVFGGQLTTAAVGSRPEGQGPYGHLDLAGNAWEWVEDEYDPYAYRRDTAGQGIPGPCAQIRETLDFLRSHKLQGFTGKNPIPVECERVLRGGAYNYGAAGLRASNRVHHPARFRIAVAGFRCAEDDPNVTRAESATEP